MHLYNRIAKQVLTLLTISAGFAACQKMDRPTVGNYPKDTNPTNGPLQFYAAFDGRSVDSIKAVFGLDTKVTYVDGVLGKAMSVGNDGYAVFPSTNDFKSTKNFTVAFWMKKAGPNPKGAGTSFAFGLSTSTDIWTRQDMFLEFEDAGNPSTADSAAAKFYLNDQWFEFTKTDQMDKRIPHVLDGQWHHLAFVFNQADTTLTPYVDGQPDANVPTGFGKFNNNGGVVNFSKSSGIVVGGPGHFAIGKVPDSWMGNFNGSIDQFRLYTTALSAAEVQALYTNKE